MSYVSASPIRFPISRVITYYGKLCALYIYITLHLKDSTNILTFVIQENTIKIYFILCERSLAFRQSHFFFLIIPVIE